MWLPCSAPLTVLGPHLSLSGPPLPSLPFKKQIWFPYPQPPSHFSNSPRPSAGQRDRVRPKEQASAMPAELLASHPTTQRASSMRPSSASGGAASSAGAASGTDSVSSTSQPPLLGFLHQRDPTKLEHLFVPSSSFRPRDHADRSNLKAVHSCHDRVLLHSAPSYNDEDALDDLFVWDRITDNLQKLPRWPLHSIIPPVERNGNAAVLCARLGDGCDHLDCHHGPFMVILAGFDEHAQTFISVYSSEADWWIEPIHAGQHYDYIEKGSSVLIGSAIYFKCFNMSTQEPEILKYDLLTQEISWIHIPRVGILEHINYRYIVLMAMEDGRLGFAGMRSWFTLFLWSRMEHGPDDEDARWAESRAIEIADLRVPTIVFRMKEAHVVNFEDTGAGGGVIFICSTGGPYSVHLKSGSCSKMLGKYGPMDYTVPYFSFCTPALGAVSIDEAPGADEPSA